MLIKKCSTRESECRMAGTTWATAGEPRVYWTPNTVLCESQTMKYARKENKSPSRTRRHHIPFPRTTWTYAIEHTVRPKHENDGKTRSLEIKQLKWRNWIECCRHRHGHCCRVHLPYALCAHYLRHGRWPLFYFYCLVSLCVNVIARSHTVEHNQTNTHINWMVVMWIIRAQMVSVDKAKKEKTASLFHATMQSINLPFLHLLRRIQASTAATTSQTNNGKIRWRRKAAMRRANNDTPFVLNSLCRACVDLRHRDICLSNASTLRQYNSTSLYLVLVSSRFVSSLLLSPKLAEQTTRSKKRVAKLFIEAKSEQIALVDKTTKYKETNLFDQWQIDFGLPSFACAIRVEKESLQKRANNFPGGREWERLAAGWCAGLSYSFSEQLTLPPPNDFAICQSTGGRMSGSPWMSYLFSIHTRREKMLGSKSFRAARNSLFLHFGIWYS